MQILVMVVWSALAGAHVHYYGMEFKILKDDPSSSALQLQRELHRVLASAHLRRPGEFDQIVGQCGSGRCIRHKRLSYKMARKKLFGELHILSDHQGLYIQDVYCEVKVRRVSRGEIPNHKLINTEHTWPQSRFSHRFSRALQKSDLHAIFPTLPRINAQRGNLKLADVDEVTHDTCMASRKGLAGNRETFFEPPDRHKGNVARALFYFSIRYKLKIPFAQEQSLRRWHRLDPVDGFERWRHESIAQIQQVRNPFVDMPGLVGRIDDF